LEEAFFLSDGTPARTGNEAHLNKFSYDKLSNLVSWKGYDDNGAPDIVPSFGSQEKRWSYSAKGLLLEESHWGASGVPIDSEKLIYHKKEFTHDDYGHILATRTYDAKGNELSKPSRNSSRINNSHYMLSSVPDGASVFDISGSFLGVTPLEIDTDKYGNSLIIKKYKYKDLAIYLDKSIEQESIVLSEDDDWYVDPMNEDYLAIIDGYRKNKIISGHSDNSNIDQKILNKFHDMAEKGSLLSASFLFIYYSDKQNSEGVISTGRVLCEKFGIASVCMTVGFGLDLESLREEALIYYLAAIGLGDDEGHFYVAFSYLVRNSKGNDLELAREHAKQYWDLKKSARAAGLLVKIL
jgi:hypothetical protein